MAQHVQGKMVVAGALALDAPAAEIMRKQIEPVLCEPAEWLGDWHPLVEQLGSTNGLAALSDLSVFLRVSPVRDLGSLREFLGDYHKRILLPVELPAIHKAFDHASRHEVRELIELDRDMASGTAVGPFADASRRIGQCELQKLKPLRDERLVRRYLEAVAQGQANAWHTLVYGVTLALYSMPLRQGLLGYGFQTTRGFIHAASRTLRLSEQTGRDLLSELCAGLPRAVESLVGSCKAA